MRTVILIIAASVSLAACGSSEQATVAYDSPYTEEQRNAVLGRFQSICLAPVQAKDERRCPEFPLIVYRLQSGKEVVGKVADINLKSGALSVSWSNTTNAPFEEFYPSSSKSVPGKLVLILNDRPAFDWIGEGGLSKMTEAEIAKYRMRVKKAMGRYGELEEQYEGQSAMTMQR